MRALERHVDLNELELCRKMPESLSGDELALWKDIGRHLERCVDCREIAEVHKLISKVSKPVTSDGICPGQEVWLDVAANTVSEIDFQNYLKHAANCANCANELRLATEIIQGDGKEIDVSQLMSSQTAWRQDTARYLHKLNAKSSRSARWRLRPRIAIAYAMAATLIAGLGYTAWYRSNPRVDSELASAANVRRLTPLHIPGAKAMALSSPVRDGSSKPEWSELLHIRARAMDGVKNDSKSGYWHQVLGRTYILQSDPESALVEFHAAQLKDPHLARIDFDLGTAYFELAEQTGDKSKYGQAGEYFISSLEASNRRDAAALFNLALCEERTGSWDKARKNLEEALEKENQSDWRQIIRSELGSLSKKDGLSETTEESPVGWNAERYESALTRVLLTDEIKDNLEALNDVAREGELHGDSWLADWLATSSSKSELHAPLAKAVKANLNGNASEALDASRRAKLFYRRAQVKSGFARSEVEEIYALQRMGRAQDCLDLIHSPLLNSTLHGYPYFEATIQLEDAACEEMIGATQRSKRAIERARTAALSNNYKAIYERAQGFLASYYTIQGSPEQAWNLNVSGLQYCRTHNCPPLRNYQFTSDLIDDSAQLGLSRFGLELAESNVGVAQQAGNLQNTAYAYEVLGQRQLYRGFLVKAQESFAHADELISRLGDNIASQEYRADWAADRSELMTQQGHRELALEHLAKVSSTISSTESMVIALNYWSRRALLEQRAGRYDVAQSSAEKSVGYAKRVRNQLSTSSEKRSWRQASRTAYATLVAAMIGNGRPTEALQVWEEYQRATEELPFLKSDRIPIRFTTQGPTLIFARLTDAFAVFSVSADGNVVASLLPYDAEIIEQLARTFSLLCSDPRSQLGELMTAGKLLYSVLLEPIVPLDHSKLWIEVSGVLGRLPFGALVLPDGAFLGVRREITVLSNSWTLRSVDSGSLLASVPILILDERGSESGAIPEAYDESQDVARIFPNSRLVDGRNLTRKEFVTKIQKAAIFHFAGHAITRQGITRLLLASRSEKAELTADWLADLHLNKLRLAVLAACTTAGFDNAQLIPGTELSDAFLQSGARYVLVSLWDVDSNATRQLMLLFYRELAKGNHPAVALEIAEKLLSETPGFQHPYFWSGFHLVH